MHTLSLFLSFFFSLSFCPALLSPGSIYLEQTKDQIGAEYKKVVFREYTDGTFAKKKLRGPDEEHLGIMGMAHLTL